MNKSQALAVAVRYAQLAMAKENPIDPDGKWGRFTQSVYEKSSPALRSHIDQVLSTAGTSASSLYAERVAERVSAAVAYASAGDIRAIVEAAAREGGVSPRLMLGFAKIESNFNPRAVNGSSRGLMQMQPAAWKDVQDMVPGLPSYSDGVFDPLQNARAGVAYIKLNARRLRALGFDEEFTPAVAYLAHQQGAGGFIELWRHSKGMPAITSYVSERAMRGNPPQDGQGVTVDKKEFYTRWMAAAQAKLDTA